MINQNLITLFLIIENHGQINSLIKKGLSFKEIANLTENSIEEGYLIYFEEKIQLSEKGKKYLAEHKSQLKNKAKVDWIEKDLKNQIPKIDNNTIFLPNQNKLDF